MEKLKSLMPRYIDADALISECEEEIVDYDEDLRKHFIVKAVPTEYIENFPAADVEEVRRCQDCRYWGEGLTEEEKDEVRKLPMADLVCGWWSSDGCCPNDFCSNAKPKHRR